MERQHRIKVLPEYFEAIVANKKHFELRKNDRDYQVGDLVYLEEYKDGYRTKRVRKKTIKYVLKDCSKYGLMEGYCIFGW